MVNMSFDVWWNDLSFYEFWMNLRGLVMIKLMFVINWLDVGDYVCVVMLFSESYVNVKELFMVWIEGVDGGGVVNFIMGVGGFL